MVWEVLGSALLGLAIALAATRWLPRGFPNRRPVLATGPAAALLGGLLGRAVTGSGHTAAVLLIAAGFGVALLSLLHGAGTRTGGLRPGIAPPAAR